MTPAPSGRTTAGKKIAILGGGMGALTAAFELTQAPERYDITVYQLGWRLGGKGASGRNMDPAYHYRIEEHGLHVWSGLYDNAFRVIRQCYDALGRAPDAPLATWQDAFKPANFFVLEEQYEGQWYHWPMTMPTNSMLPGDPDAKLFLPLWAYLEEALELMWQLFKKSPHAEQRATRSLGDFDFSSLWLGPFIERLASDIEVLGLNQAGRALYAAYHLSKLQTQGPSSLLAVLGDDFMRLANRLGDDLRSLVQRLILLFLALFMGWYWRIVKDDMDNTETRRLWIMMNFAYGHIRGVIEDDILEKGFDVINDQDYRAWFGQYIVDDGGLTINSPWAWFFYDAVFSYRDGKLDQPDLEAGVALYCLVRMAFTWKGALIWRMQAGMGDTVFTPLYEVLKARGVKFEFFHRVKQLHLSADKKSIARITMGRQVRLKKGEYQPLITVKGLACWPSTPLYDQIVDGEKLKKEGINLEEFCTPDVEEFALEAGKDFDQVVLGISLGALPYLCCELVQASEKWKQLVNNVKTVRTQAAQLWLKPTAYEMGWTMMGQPMLTTYRVNPLDTWADMSELIEREGWPADGERYPQNLAYLVGPMPEKPLPSTECGPKQDCAALDQRKGTAQTRATTVDFLRKDAAHLWPQATRPPGNPTAPFDWSLLVDDRPGKHAGEARLDAQYIRANVQPSERYVISATGTSRYRLPPGKSGFTNLVLAGDWTDNGFNMGNIESTVMSGMLASNAISGYPARDQIVGVDFGHPPPAK